MTGWRLKASPEEIRWPLQRLQGVVVVAEGVAFVELVGAGAGAVASAARSS